MAYQTPLTPIRPDRSDPAAGPRRWRWMVDPVGTVKLVIAAAVIVIAGAGWAASPTRHQPTGWESMAFTDPGRYIDGIDSREPQRTTIVVTNHHPNPKVYPITVTTDAQPPTPAADVTVPAGQSVTVTVELGVGQHQHRITAGDLELRLHISSQPKPD